MNDVMISDMEHAPRPICRHLARKFGMFSCNLLGMKVPCARILAMKRSSFIKIVFDSGPCALKEKHIYILIQILLICCIFCIGIVMFNIKLIFRGGYFS